MGKPDALSAALPVVDGYHSQFPLLEEELELLYVPGGHAPGDQC